MTFLETRHTKALVCRIQKDLNKISFILTIITQVFLLLYYAFSIYSHREELIYIILYSCLAAISIFVFIEQIIFHQKYKKKKEDEIKLRHKKLNTIAKSIGIVNKTCLLILSNIPIVQGKASDFDKVATIALLILLLVQTGFMFFSILLNRYIKWFMLAFELDKKESFGIKKIPTNVFHKFVADKDDDLKEVQFRNQFEDELEEVEKKEETKKKQEKEERSNQFKRDISTLKSNIKNKIIDKKTSSKKIDQKYLESKKYAVSIVQNQKKIDKLILDVIDSIYKKPLNEELSYIEYFLYALRDKQKELTPKEKEALIINLNYYLHPLIKNNSTTKDNLEILTKTREEYVELDDLF